MADESRREALEQIARNLEAKAEANRPSGSKREDDRYWIGRAEAFDEAAAAVRQAGDG